MKFRTLHPVCENPYPNWAWKSVFDQKPVLEWVIWWFLIPVFSLWFFLMEDVLETISGLTMKFNSAGFQNYPVASEINSKLVTQSWFCWIRIVNQEWLWSFKNHSWFSVPIQILLFNNYRKSSTVTTSTCYSGPRNDVCSFLDYGKTRPNFGPISITITSKHAKKHHIKNHKNWLPGKTVEMAENYRFVRRT